MIKSIDLKYNIHKIVLSLISDFVNGHIGAGEFIYHAKPLPDMIIDKEETCIDYQIYEIQLRNKYNGT